MYWVEDGVGQQDPLVYHARFVNSALWGETQKALEIERAIVKLHFATLIYYS
jgi:hypothetical protein